MTTGTTIGHVRQAVAHRNQDGVAVDGRHVAALLCGGLGLFAFNLVLGPIAMGLGAVAARRAAAGSFERRAGVVGLVLGLADVVLLAAFLAPGLGHGGIVWQPGF